MFSHLQYIWDEIQDFLDISGDVWMGLFTLIVLIRYMFVLKGSNPITTAEAMTYASAVSAFAYSNKK